MDINKILKDHEKYLITFGKEGIRANLSGTDLSGTDLSGANLRSADLSGADLSGAYLRDAYLRDADLSGADLSGSYLRDADLSGANLRSSDLSGADLRSSDLSGANLISADLSGANLISADLSGAYLSGVIANSLTSGFWMVCPENGSFIGFKKADGKIIKLKVPETAKRSSATTRKCRVSQAKVISIESIDGKEKFSNVSSDIDKNFIYKVGKTVKVTDFDENRWNECSTGIHLFITRREAEIYC